MRNLPIALFVAGIITVVVTLFAAIGAPGDWLLLHGEGYKLTAITFFAASAAAQLIWGERR